MDQPDNSRKIDNNALTRKTKAGILGGSGIDDCILHKSLPSKAIKLQVPQALWSGTQPKYDRLRIFGCEAFTHVPQEKRTKLAPHSRKCIFLGYGTDDNFGYRICVKEHKKLISRNDVVFNEDSMSSA